MELNIFNGDCAYDAWRESGGNSSALVWRENYLEGRIPEHTASLEEFERIRAEELHALMPELSVEKLIHSLRNMNKTVTGLSQDDSVFLWFDACMYDQIMLSRILFLMKNAPASVFLICDDVVWGGSPELFISKKKEASLLNSDEIALYASAWKALSKGCDSVKCFQAENKLERFPFLKKAIARYLEEFPGTDSLGRSERQLLEFIRSGKHSFLEIFQAFDDYEEYQFMGDAMCLNHLSALEKKGFISTQNDDNKTIYSIVAI